MKKYISHILALVFAAAIIILFVTGNNRKKRRLNEKITLRRQDKIPYGTYVAFQNLPWLFPAASIYTSRAEPGYWDSLSFTDPGQAYIAVTGTFNADEYEMKKLLEFVENGNDVFVSAAAISYDVKEMILNKGNSEVIADFDDVPGNETADSLHIGLNSPPFDRKFFYTYPGKKFSAFFNELDTTVTGILGEDKQGRPGFIHLRAGKGNFYLHLAPLAFSNYFLLHKKNIEYYEKVLSLINPGVTKIVWDEYYLNKRQSKANNGGKKGWLTVLFSYPAMRAALLTAIFSLLLYVLLEMRRKQRYIPVVGKPKNDSLNFVKTIGRLYYDKSDHKNLSRKMGAYFLEHVRSRYKLLTGNLDDEFIKTLQYKSGAEESTIRGIVSFIKYADDAPVITGNELNDFHKQLELFYQKV